MITRNEDDGRTSSDRFGQWLEFCDSCDSIVDRQTAQTDTIVILL
jgi:hypothetical protein